MILKKGSRGDEVKELQEYLGLYVDGIFGNKTHNAVCKWQHDNSLAC